MPIRVVIIDDHAVIRAGMRMLLEGQADITIVGEGTNGEEALRLAHDLKPDVIVMDVTMPGMNGIEATRTIKAEMPDIAVLALTIHEETDYYFQMLQAGASGYVPKRSAPVDLIRAIQTVAEGQVFLEPSVAKQIVADYLVRVQHDSEEYLTPREREVLILIAEDHPNHAIADRLSISVKTVERHRENIMRKLDLHSRTELVKYALRKQLISLDNHSSKDAL